MLQAWQHRTAHAAQKDDEVHRKHDKHTVQPSVHQRADKAHQRTDAHTQATIQGI